MHQLHLRFKDFRVFFNEWKRAIWDISNPKRNKTNKKYNTKNKLVVASSNLLLFQSYLPRFTLGTYECCIKHICWRRSKPQQGIHVWYNLFSLYSHLMPNKWQETKCETSNESSSSIYFAFRHDIHITVHKKQNLNNKTIAHNIYNITVMLKRYV